MNCNTYAFLSTERLVSFVKTLTTVMFGLQLDSWSVILNGSVEVTYPEGRTELLCMGNSFGVSPTMEKEYMKGVMKTKVDDCQVGWCLHLFAHHFSLFP